MLLLGTKPPGRNVEQHDFFFGIATSLKDLVPDIKKFWPEAGEKIHIDGWREVNVVDGYRVSITSREKDSSHSSIKLFFINLGGYQENKFEEQHYVVLSVHEDRVSASNAAKTSLFYKHNHFGSAVSHIDDKYGIDVDDLYQIEDILSPAQKEMYSIELIPDKNAEEDNINLGYLKLSSLK